MMREGRGGRDILHFLRTTHYAWHHNPLDPSVSAITVHSRPPVTMRACLPVVLGALGSGEYRTGGTLDL